MARKATKFLILSPESAFIPEMCSFNQFVKTVFPFHHSQLRAQSSSNSLFPIISSSDISLSDDTPISLILNEIPTNTFSDQIEESDSPSYSMDVTTPVITSRPTRVRQLPSRFKDFTGLPSTHAILPSLSTSMSDSGNVYPIQNYLSYSFFFPNCQAYLANTSKIPIPYNFTQAALRSHWFQAMKAELMLLIAIILGS